MQKTEKLHTGVSQLPVASKQDQQDHEQERFRSSGIKLVDWWAMVEARAAAEDG